MFGFSYHQHLRLNISLYYFYRFLFNSIFLYAIWYTFETQFLSVFVLGILYAVARFVITILELPTGALADLIGRKYTVSLGFLIEGLSWVLLGAFPSSTIILIAYMVNSVGTALSSGADSALLFDTLKELRQEKDFAKITSNANLFMRISFVVSSIIGGYIFSFSQGLPYVLTGIFMMGAGLIAALSQEPKLDSETFTLRNYMNQTKSGLKELTKTSLVRLFSLFYMINGGITWYYIYFLHTVLFTEVFTLSELRGWVMGAVSALAGLALLLAARLISATNHRQIIALFTVATILTTFPAITFNQSFLVIAGGILYFLAIARFSFLDQVANDYFESRYRATALSALSMGVSLVFILWSIVGGWILDRWSIQALLTILGVFFVLTTTPIVWKIFKLER